MRLLQNTLVIIALVVVFAPLTLAWFFWQWAEARRRTRQGVRGSSKGGRQSSVERLEFQ
jgi:hypothetical protein